MPEAKLKITIYSDFICPFCYIGKDRAENLKKEFDIEIEWKMIEIHPEIPVEGMATKSINSPYLQQVWYNVEQLAKESNLDIIVPPILANSKLANIVSEFAQLHHKFEEFHHELFEAYWRQGKNIGQIGVIKEIAQKVDLDNQEMLKYIDSNVWKEKLEKKKQESLDHLVTGVPTFVINDKIVTGAQPYSLIRKIVKKELIQGNSNDLLLV